MIISFTSKVHVISESPTAIHIYPASSWKAVSTKVVPCLQLWLKVPADKFSIESDIVEILHTGTLL